MTVLQDVQTSNPSAVVELYSLDATALGQGMFYFTNQVNEKGTSVIWQNIPYAFIPVDGSGWGKTLNGSAPRPTLTIDNTQKAMQAAVIAAGDLTGCRLTRTRVLSKYLDASNFNAGNPTADTTMILSSDIYVINKKTSHNKQKITFELAWPLDVQGVRLPREKALRSEFPSLGLNR